MQRKGHPGITPSPEAIEHYRSEGLEPPKVCDWAGSPLPSVASDPTILMIMIDFPDHAGTQTQAHYQTLLFGGAQGSLNHYYTEVSYGQLAITGVMAGSGWYRSAHNMVWWGADTDTANGRIDDANSDIFELAREAVVAADANVNFATYDTNNNHVIDPNELSICIVHAGNGQESSAVATNIWSHRWYIFGAGYSSSHTGPLPDTFVGGCRISKHPGDNVGGYFMQAENSPMGTFAHEFAHDLGAIDLYDTDSGVDYGAVVGSWSLMDSGSWLNSGNTPSHLDPYFKVQMGWLTPTVVDHYLVTNIDQTESSTGNRLYRVNIPGTQQYYLVENRERTGYDSYLPEAGVLIWHIDERMPDHIGNTAPPLRSNDGPPDNSYYRVAVEQPGGTGNDPYGHPSGSPNYRGALNTAAYSSNDGQNTFDSRTTPDSDFNEGTRSRISVWNIGAEGPAMSVTFFKAFAYVHCSWGGSTMNDETAHLNSLDPTKYSFVTYDETNIGDLWSNLIAYKAILIDEDTFYDSGSWVRYGGPIYDSFRSHASQLDTYIRTGGAIFTSGENDLFHSQAWDWLPPAMQVTSFDPEQRSDVHIVYDPGSPYGLYSMPNTITDIYLSQGHTHAYFTNFPSEYVVTVRRTDNNNPIELFGVFGTGCVVVSHVEAEMRSAWAYLQNQLDYAPASIWYAMAVVSPREDAVFRAGNPVEFCAVITDIDGNPSSGASVTVNSPSGVGIHLVETSPGTGIYNATYVILPTDTLGNWTIAFVAAIEGEFPKQARPLKVRMIGDVNADGKVDMKDIYLVAKAYNSHPGDPNWNLMVDENDDGKIDVKDVYLTAKNFGKKCF